MLCRDRGRYLRRNASHIWLASADAPPRLITRDGAPTAVVRRWRPGCERRPGGRAADCLHPVRVFGFAARRATAMVGCVHRPSRRTFLTGSIVAPTELLARWGRACVCAAYCRWTGGPLCRCNRSHCQSDLVPGCEQPDLHRHCRRSVSGVVGGRTARCGRDGDVRQAAPDDDRTRRRRELAASVHDAGRG